MVGLTGFPATPAKCDYLWWHRADRFPRELREEINSAGRWQVLMETVWGKLSGHSGGCEDRLPGATVRSPQGQSIIGFSVV